MNSQILINSQVSFLRKITDERFVLQFNPLEQIPGFAGPCGPQPDPAPLRR